MPSAQRLGFEYSDKAEKMLKTAFKTRGLKESPKRAVYLALACTDPSAQGKGERLDVNSSRAWR